MFSDIRASGELSMALARRDFSAKYRQSLLGYVWAFLPVLGTTFTFLFLRSGNAFQTGDNPQIAYPVYVFIGTALWQVFIDAVNGPLRMVTSSRAMLVKINFPREALIMAGMLMTLLNFAIRLMLIVPGLIFFASRGMYSFDPHSLYLFPLGIIALIQVGYSIGLILTPIGLLYRDIQMAMGMIMTFWMFLTPVVLTLENAKGIVLTVMQWNPVSSVLDTARAWLLGVEPLLLPQMLIMLPFAAVLLCVGWILFRIALPHVIARLGM
jgi:lipopolysaccharide transport system permease protein